MISFLILAEARKKNHLLTHFQLSKRVLQQTYWTDWELICDSAKQLEVWRCDEELSHMFMNIGHKYTIGAP